MDKNDVLERVESDGVKFVSLQFTDVTGAVKSVDIPIHRLASALEDGVWFDGSSVEGFARIQESDMLLILDPETYTVLPWSPVELRRARLFCDIYPTGWQSLPWRPTRSPQAYAEKGRTKRLDL